jgi:WD40 repeat protein
MFSSHAAEISLNAPCRALAAVQADKTESRFLVGSCGVDDVNHLHVVRFHSEVNELGIDAKIEHATGPVTAICCSPSDPSLVLTAAEGSNDATLWKIPRSIMSVNESLQYDPEEDDALDLASSAVMEEVMTLNPPQGGSSSPMVDIVWRDTAAEEESSSPGEVLTMNLNGQLTQWDAVTGTAVRSVPTSSNTFTAGFQPRVAWDPHTSMAVAVTTGTRVGILDWRVDTSTPTGTVESFQCHRYGVTDLDYNPNKPYVLVTSGQDGMVKFWDVRTAKRPLLVARGGHSHWVSNVKYNPFHDQLVLSSGTDSVANLWRLSTISSAPLLTMNDDASGDMSESSAPNVRVARHEHGDSIYATSWAAADAWIYMVIGYDGKAVLNHVPSKEKYKILL